jgi:phospholipid transport system substrate-binding protein
LCLGRHWRTASEAQRAEYVALFCANVLAVLSRRMSHYTGGEKFVVTASRPAGDDAMVASEIDYATNDPPLRIDWRVRNNGGSPTIIDVLPEGVSLVLTYRSEFDEVVARDGMDGLMAELRARAAAKKA